MAALNSKLSSDLSHARQALRRLADPKKKAFLQGYFKTGPGEYAEGDVFLGVMVPMTRTVAREFRHLDLKSVESLIKSKIHEERLLALFILGEQFNRALSIEEKSSVYSFVLKHRRFINNWDLVDTAAPAIVGKLWLESLHLDDQKKLLRSKALWDRRIAIVGLFPLMRAKKESLLAPTLKQALKFDHDLLHKAGGWLLRDWIKSGSKKARVFLESHRLSMPRTMLRYAIEHQSPAERKRLMTKA